MALIADGLLLLAALAASLYCWVLSKRLRRLTQLDKGLGAAITSLSEQVSEMQFALNQSKAGIEEKTEALQALTEKAAKVESSLKRLLDQSGANGPKTAQSDDLLRVEITESGDEPEEQEVAKQPLDPERLASILAKTGETGGQQAQSLERLLKALRVELEEPRA
ncbi:MAG: hypothetical protein AAGA26_00845 [Pseudomonadota bacterium]